MTIKDRIKDAYNHPLAAPLKSTLENRMLKWGYIGTCMRETLFWYADVWKTARCRSNYRKDWLQKSPLPVRFFTEIFTSRASRKSIDAIPSMYAGFGGGCTLAAGIIGAIKTAAPVFLLKSAGLALAVTVAAPMAAITFLTLLAYPAFTLVGTIRGMQEACLYIKSPKNYLPPGTPAPPQPQPTQDEIVEGVKSSIMDSLYSLPMEARKKLFLDLRKVFNGDYGDIARDAALKGTSEKIVPLPKIVLKAKK